MGVVDGLQDVSEMLKVVVIVKLLDCIYMGPVHRESNLIIFQDAAIRRTP